MHERTVSTPAQVTEWVESLLDDDRRAWICRPDTEPSHVGYFTLTAKRGWTEMGGTTGTLRGAG